MKNWMRIFWVCFFMIGGTAFFAYYTLNQFNKALDNLSASSFAIAKIPPTTFYVKTAKEQIPAPAPETASTPTTPTSTPATSTDLKLSFLFPEKDGEIYMGCAYQLTFQSSTTLHSLETALIDAGSKKTIDPGDSGLASENKIGPNSQSLNWKVGVVWPGEYYIKVSNINGAEFKEFSEFFVISRMPKDASVDEKKKICKESGGSF